MKKNAMKRAHWPDLARNKACTAFNAAGLCELHAQSILVDLIIWLVGPAHTCSASTLNRLYPLIGVARGVHKFDTDGHLDNRSSGGDSDRVSE